MMLISYSLTGLMPIIIIMIVLIYLYSINGHSVLPVPPYHFYSATKHAITAIAEGVRQELKEMKSNCRCTVSIY